MSQLRLDPLTGRWVVVSSERAERPFALSFQPRSLPIEDEPGRPCPFCPGSIDADPSTLEIPDPSGDSDWLVKVVANRYPAFGGREPMAVTNLGPVFTQAPASGIHEVLVLSRDHGKSWADLDTQGSDAVMTAVASRMRDHAATPGLRYSQVIVNAGREAGASMEHPHGQLLGMPFVPREITDELAGFARFAGNCLLCATADAEESAGHRVVYADSDVIVVCPYWSGTPYEMLAIPASHQPHLYDAEADDLAAYGNALRRSLASLRNRLGDVPYNVAFHSAPYKTSSDFHWHAHVLPKVTTRAGFELGTGVLINVVNPEIAAEELRKEAKAA